jgi:Zn-finger nucleic acid-binding protein
MLGSLMVGDLLIDVCTKGCGGALFNPFELERMLKDDREAAQAFVRARPPRDATTEAPIEPGPRQCPRCHLPMLRRLANPAASTYVHECPSCGARWIDGDDLTSMLQDESTTEDRKKALDRRFYEEFGEPLAREQHQEERKRRRMRAIGNAATVLGPLNPNLWNRQIKRNIDQDG